MAHRLHGCIAASPLALLIAACGGAAAQDEPARPPHEPRAGVSIASAQAPSPLRVPESPPSSPAAAPSDPPAASSGAASEAGPPSEEVIAAARAAAVRRPGGITTRGGARLAGDCVDPALDVAARYGDLDAAPSPLEEAVDLDGDGASDLLLGGASGMNTTWDLYVMRGDCGHHAGQITVGVSLEATPRFVRGMRVLESRSGCPVESCDDVLYTASWSGRAYVVTERRLAAPASPRSK